jgi:hypothetical protein
MVTEWENSKSGEDGHESETKMCQICAHEEEQYAFMSNRHRNRSIQLVRNEICAFQTH